MDDRASSSSVVAGGEDRISNLHDNIILHILSFLDLKYAVRTSALSRKWKHTWTSIPCVNLNPDVFQTKYKFSKFVKRALTCRNTGVKDSAIKLTFRGSIVQGFVNNIVTYTYSYNVSKLTLIWPTCTYDELPEYLFSSCTLKHLTLDNQAHVFYRKSRIKLNSAWRLPALETLNLTDLEIGYIESKRPNLFSECVNLKDITLCRCSVNELGTFTICTPQLVNLTITDCDIWSSVLKVKAPQLKNLTVSCNNTFPKFFSFNAPQLENLTASVSTSAISFPFNHFLSFSRHNFNSLEKVNLSLRSRYNEKQEVSQRLLDLFKILRSAKSLILDVHIIESLSSSLDQLAHEPCPFNNLKLLKINMVPLKQKDPIPAVFTQVINYLLENSPYATVNMDLPQVPQKRSWQQVPNEDRPKKATKLETGISTMVDEKKLLEAQIQMQDQVIAKLRAEIEKKDEVNAKQRAELEKKDQVIAELNERIQMQNVNNIQSQLVHAAELPAVPGPSSANASFPPT
uniref:FBD-associated F-box protein At2g26860-like n=1 Tax=Erigeron canadensis TaxID=72917 RepID=UPI001CB99696|nr:FBD-associated F-box protein At2g26860-like [Erigeron canadensis]